MVNITDNAVGASSYAGSAKLKDALMFISGCQKDPNHFMSDQWSSTMKSLQGEVMSLRTLFRYSKIGHEGYHEFQSLVTNALFFISRALDDNDLYRKTNINYSYLLEDSMEDLRPTIERICRYTTSKVPTYVVGSSVDLLAESINYLLRLVRMNSSGLRLEDEVDFWKHIAFLEFIYSYISNHRIMSKLKTPEHLRVNNQAAIDMVINILSEFDPLHSWLDSNKDFINPAANIGMSTDFKLQKLGNIVEFISIAIYAAIEEGPSSSWIDEVTVQFLDSFIDSILHLDQETVLTIPWKEQMEVLHDELSFLKYFLLDPPKEHTGKNTSKLMGQIKHEICKQVTALIYSFYDSKLRKQAIGEIREAIDYYRSLFKESFGVPYFVRREHKKNYGSGSESDDPFWEKLFILIHSESVFPLCRTKKVLEELTYCKDSLNKIVGVELIKDDLQVEIRELAIVLEYVINPPAVRSCPVWHRILWFLDIVDRLKLIRKTLSAYISMSDYGSADFKKDDELYVALLNKWLVTLDRKDSIFDFVLSNKI